MPTRRATSIAPLELAVGLAGGLLAAAALVSPAAGAAVASGAAAVAGGSLRPLEVNLDELVEMAVLAEVAAPGQGDPPYRIAPDGTALALPGTGSITYNFRTGDSAVRMAGDHVEPGVSVYHPGADKDRGSAQNRGLNVLACVGNRARVLTGDAKGAEGTVIGKHGGVEHVMLDFPDATYDKLAIGDKIQVRAVGLGMEALNVSDVYLRNMSPDLLHALNRNGLGVTVNGRLRVPVTHLIPARIMGSGLGARHVHSGDYDIQMFDEKTVREHRLDTLRFGDLVAILDADNAFGRSWREGAISVGIVVHGISRVAGHGPGVTTLITSPAGNIDLVVDPRMNLGRLLPVR